LHFRQKVRTRSLMLAEPSFTAGESRTIFRYAQKVYYYIVVYN